MFQNSLCQISVDPHSRRFQIYENVIPSDLRYLQDGDIVSIHENDTLVKWFITLFCLNRFFLFPVSLHFCRFTIFGYLQTDIFTEISCFADTLPFFLLSHQLSEHEHDNVGTIITRGLSRGLLGPLVIIVPPLLVRIAHSGKVFTQTSKNPDEFFA